MMTAGIASSSAAPVAEDHPFVGEWVTEDEDNFVVIEIGVVGGSFSVSAKDKSDGETFQIIEPSWDGEALRFTTLMPSTHFRAGHVLRLREDGRASLELTVFEVWKKLPSSQRA